MINLKKAKGYGMKAVADWIHNKLQNADGSIRAGFTDDTKNNLQPGLAFQAAITLHSLGDHEHANAAIKWAYQSGLLYGDHGWVDWKDAISGQTAETWQCFIDTAFYNIAAIKGGIDFNY